MRMSHSFTVRLLEAAVAEAVSDARWERVDLETRKPHIGHRDLMLAKAAELALSPVARDQLLSIALERSAQDLPPGRPLVDVRCASAQRAPIAARVFGLGPHRASETDALVLGVEERHSRMLRPEIRFDLLSQKLEQDAILNEALWDHPNIPASDAVRLAMLCSVPKLRERAQDLTISNPVWWRPVRRWLNAISDRSPR